MTRSTAWWAGPEPTAAGSWPTRSGRLPGDLRAGAIATLDGNPADACGSRGSGRPTRPATGSSTDLPDPSPSTPGPPGGGRRPALGADLADGEHRAAPATVQLPPWPTARSAGSVVDVPVSFPALTGAAHPITVDTVRLENTAQLLPQEPIAMPLGIAEVGIPGLHAAPLPATIPSSCRSDLLAIDGQPAWVAVSGSTQTALARTAAERGPVRPRRRRRPARGRHPHPHRRLRRHPGEQPAHHRVRPRPAGPRLGAGRDPAAPVSATAIAAPPAQPAPTVDVASQTSTTMHLRCERGHRPGLRTGHGTEHQPRLDRRHRWRRVPRPTGPHRRVRQRLEADRGRSGQGRALRLVRRDPAMDPADPGGRGSDRRRP